MADIRRSSTGHTPHSQSSIEAHNLDFVVPDSDDPTKKHVQILFQLCAKFEPGTCTAIMGPSGAGKTTFMKALCGQADYGTLSGSITENGVAIDQMSLRHRFGYASQDDILWPVLTARELLTYAASMRIKEPIEARQQRVEKLLTLLGMDKPDVVIGDEHNPGGLSGGQKKRVSIAMELITEPAVLLLDEPTTGLDSQTAAQVCETLSDMAKIQNTTILTTIHQPTWEMIENFDQLLILHRGALVFAQSPQSLPPYLYECVKTEENPRKSRKAMYDANFPENPLDRLMECLSDDCTGQWAERWASEKQDKISKDNNLIFSRRDNPAQNHMIRGNQYDYCLSTCCQVLVLFRRSTYMYIKTKSGLRLTLIANIVMNLFIGLAFFDPGFKMSGTLMSNGCNAVIVSTMISFTMITINTVPLQKAILQREVSSGYYSPLAFWMSQLAMRAMFALLIGLVCFPISYFMLGLTATKFSNLAACYFVWVSIAYIAQTIAFPIGTLARDAAGAVQMSAPFIMPLMLLGGVLRRIDSSHAYTLWFTYSNPVTYFFKIYLYNATHGHSDEHGTGNDLLDFYDVTYKQQVWAWMFVLSFAVGVSIIGFFPTASALTKTKVNTSTRLAQPRQVY